MTLQLDLSPLHSDSPSDYTSKPNVTQCIVCLDNVGLCVRMFARPSVCLFA